MKFSKLQSQKFKILVLGIAGIIYLSAFTVTGLKNDEQKIREIGPDDWMKYKSWHHVTSEPNTGDPTGFLAKKHKGLKGHREIFINSVGEAVSKGEADLPYPEGTIVVKAAFKDESAYKAQSKAELTVMIKMAAGASPETADWEFVMGASGDKRGSGTSKWGKFCGDCHINAAATDYVFTKTQ